MPVIIKVNSLRNLVVLLWMSIGAITCQNSTDGLRCLECHEVKAPSACKQWVTCGHEEECYVREFYDRNMDRGYHMGCELKSRCDLYNRMAAVIGRRRASPDCFQCCAYDDCNTGLCATESTPVNTNTNLRCLDCHSVSDPHLCDKWSRCGEDEVCFTRAFTDSTGLQKFRMGCEFKQMCSLPSNGGVTTTPDPRTCMECCQSQDCNSQLCRRVLSYTAATTPPPTSNTSQNGCPPDFVREGNSCYYFSNTTLPWINANTACEKMGAELVAVETQAEQDILEQILNNTALYKATAYWIGGFYVTATNNWEWMNLHPLSYTKWGPSQPNKSRFSPWYNYRLAMMNPAKNSGYKEWSWAAGSYNTRYNYICETDAM